MTPSGTYARAHDDTRRRRRRLAHHPKERDAIALRATRCVTAALLAGTPRTSFRPTERRAYLARRMSWALRGHEAYYELGSSECLEDTRCMLAAVKPTFSWCMTSAASFRRQPVRTTRQIADLDYSRGAGGDGEPPEPYVGLPPEVSFESVGLSACPNSNLTGDFYGRRRSSVDRGQHGLTLAMESPGDIS